MALCPITTRGVLGVPDEYVCMGIADEGVSLGTGDSKELFLVTNRVVLFLFSLSLPITGM